MSSSKLHRLHEGPPTMEAFTFALSTLVDLPVCIKMYVPLWMGRDLTNTL